MEHTGIALCLSRQRPHTGEERRPECPSISPCGKDVVDGRLVHGRCPVGVCRHGQALPVHPGGEDPEDEIADARRAPCALWARAWASRGTAREMFRTPVRRVGQGLASLQVLVPWCSSCNGLRGGKGRCTGEAEYFKYYKSLGVIEKLATSYYTGNHGDSSVRRGSDR